MEGCGWIYLREHPPPPVFRPTAERLLHHAFFKAAKKKQYLVDMVASLPPISERQQGEPKKEVAPRASGQSWDFSEDNTTEEIDSVDDLGLAAKLAQSRASLVTGSDSQLARSDSKELSPQSSTSVESLDRQPVALAPTSAGPDGTLSPVNGSTAQKKGRFVVDVAATGNKPVVSAATTAQPSNVPTQQPPHMTADLHHIAPLDPSAFRVQVSGNTPPPGAGEVRKGRFSVMGEASKETPAAAGDVAKPKMVAVIADGRRLLMKEYYAYAYIPGGPC